MTTKIATLTTHPTDPEIATLTTPANDQGATMRGFEPATYSPERRAYLVPIALLDQLHAYLKSRGVHLVDERTTPPKIVGQHGAWCPVHGHNPCPPGVTYQDWANRNPDEAAQLQDGLAAIKNRSQDARGRTP